jgi:Flp pilus assembly pilin Flp
MLSAFVHLQVELARPRRDDRGQTTAEYALVLLGAAAVALALVAWATKSGKFTQLFDAVIDHVLSNL